MNFQVPLPLDFDCDSYSAFNSLFYGYYGYYVWVMTVYGCDWGWCVYGAIGLSVYYCWPYPTPQYLFVTGCYKIIGMSNNWGWFPP